MTTDPPSRIGRYVIEAEIARGGMGTVYRARDPRIDRPIALKVLHPLLAADPVHGAELRARFVNEARAVGRLTHPAIVPVHDAGEDPESQLAWFAMELVDGRGLDEILARGLPPAQLLALGATLAEALDHAHERGVIHRDLKPSNVLIDAGGRPRLIDFSVAHLTGSSLTHPGALIGTPAYMAPEQLMGGEIGPKSDIFALGMLLCEGLTGERPRRTAALALVLPDPAAPPAMPISADEYRAILPVIQRALAMDPDDRPPDGVTMVEDLGRALEEAGKAASGLVTQPGTATVGARRTPWPFLAIAVTLLVAAILRWAMRGAEVEEPGPPTSAAPAGTVGAAGATVATPPAPAATPPAPAAQGELLVRCASRQEGTLVLLVDGIEVYRAETEDMPLAEAEGPREVRGASVRLSAGAHLIGVSFLNPRRPGEGLYDEVDGVVVPPGGSAELSIDVGFWGGRIELDASGAPTGTSAPP